MMKKKLILLSVIVSCAIPAFAQDRNTPIGSGAKTNIESLSNVGVGKTYDNRYEGTKGSPFLLDEFVKADIKLMGNVVLKSIPVKYNVFDNNVVYTDAKGALLAFGANQVEQLSFNNPKTGTDVVLRKLEGLETANPKAADKLVAFLFDGNATKFTVLHAKDLIKADYKGSSYSSGRTYDEFYDKNEYYLKSKNGKVEKVKLNKKSLLNSLADKEGEIKSYISKEKIDATTEAGWIKVLAYYDKL